MTRAREETMELAERLIREPEAKAMTGLSRTRRWEMEKAGTFPKRRILGHRCAGYLLSEVLEWMRSRPTSTYEEPAPLRQARADREAA
jgi:prophage regulatory protein